MNCMSISMLKRPPGGLERTPGLVTGKRRQHDLGSIAAVSIAYWHEDMVTIAHSDGYIRLIEDGDKDGVRWRRHQTRPCLFARNNEYFREWIVFRNI